jgi:uncharacterized protein (TIGR03083 family)
MRSSPSTDERRRALDERDHIAAVVREGRALLAGAAAGYDGSVSAYPTWTVADVVAHTGSVHRWVRDLVAERSPTRLERHPQRERDPERLAAWFVTGLEDLAEALTAASPSDVVWTFAEDRSVAFWCRRMAHETSVHRWDVQEASGDPDPIERDLASTGIPETLEIHLARPLRGAPLGGRGERLALRCTDTSDEWIVSLMADHVRVDRGPGDADASIAGLASDVWLSIMDRPATGLLRQGDPSVEAAFRRTLGLVPPPEY